MRKPFLSISIARIISVAPLVLTVLVILALVLSAGAEFIDPGV